MRPDRRGFVAKMLGDLLSCGWTIQQVPADGRVPNNGAKLILRSEDKDVRLRVLIYKVTTSGRSRPHERRVEITSTYRSGLAPLRGFSDVVLGVDSLSGKYVGVDSRRLRLGGATHNASSFFDLEGLAVKAGELRLNPRQVANTLFPTGTEMHAFFDRTRLAEYFFNHEEIHAGIYGYGGAFSGPIRSRNIVLPKTIPREYLIGDSFALSSRKQTRRLKIRAALVTAVEEGDFSKLNRAKVSPEQLKKILALCDEIGALGEQAVLTSERNRLRKLGFAGQARKVERVSLNSVGEGYDILSYEDDGITKRYLEVKATIGKGMIVDISRGEWKAAKRHGRHYYLVRVTNAKGSTQLRYIPDITDLEKRGIVTRTPTGWRLDLGAAVSLAR